MNIGSSGNEHRFVFSGHFDSLSQGDKSAAEVWYKQTGSLVPPNWEFGTTELGEWITVGLYFDYGRIILRPSFDPTSTMAE